MTLISSFGKVKGEKMKGRKGAVENFYKNEQMFLFVRKEKMKGRKMRGKKIKNMHVELTIFYPFKIV